MTQERMKKRIEICQKLLTYANDKRFERIITFNEKCLYYHYPETLNQLIDKASQAVVKFRRY